MELNEFNNAPADEAAALVRACAHVERWVAEIVAGRPYTSVDEVVAAAEQRANPWTDSEIDSALARHPRIGERARGEEADAQMSRREQSGVSTDADTQTRLAPTRPGSVTSSSSGLPAAVPRRSSPHCSNA